MTDKIFAAGRLRVSQVTVLNDPDIAVVGTTDDGESLILRYGKIVRGTAHSGGIVHSADGSNWSEWSRGIALNGISIERYDPVTAKKLPDPTLPYAEFMLALVAYGDTTNLGTFERAAGSQSRLWTVNMSQHMSEALKDEIVEVNMMKQPTGSGDKVHGYEIKAEARAYWQNGAEAELSADQLLTGWKAMMSLTKTSEDAS